MMTANKALRTSRQPKHRQVREFVLDQMLSERLKVGEALPTESLLAESLGVGRNTVRQALGGLVSEGYIQRVPGRGVFVAKEVQGLILPDVRGALYPSLIKGFGEVASDSHHPIVIYETNNEMTRQGDAILQMIDRRVTGVAIVPTTEGIKPYQLRQLEEHGIPFVLCHRGMDDLEATVITWAWGEVGRVAAHAIYKKGHRRMAFVGFMRYRYTQLYEQAFRQTLKEYGLEIPESRVLYNEHFLNPASDDQARAELTTMLHAVDRPTAIFANDLDVAERIYLEAIRLGMSVPEDLSIVAFGGKWREGSIREQLAAVVIDEVELGRRAAKVLDDLQGNPSAQVEYKQMIMPLEFTASRSLAEPPSEISHT